MREALCLFTLFVTLVSLPCFATAVTGEPVAVNPLAMAEALYPGIPLGTTVGGPYGPIPEGWEMVCCTALLDGPYGDNQMVLPFTGTIDATEGFQYGSFYLYADYTDPGGPDYFLTATSALVPLDPAPEPALGWGAGIALVAFVLAWEFRRRRGASPGCACFLRSQSERIWENAKSL
jgi:hypothetical protein